MSNAIANKCVWITGASSGIGEALAYSFAKKGANLVLSARSIDKLKLTENKLTELGVNCLVLALDVTDANSFQAATKQVIEKFNAIDYLINNAGISQRSEAKETSIEVDRKIMEVNFFGTVGLTKTVLEQMLKNKSGHITVISSISGKFGFPLRTAYSASKHALQGYFESLRAELHDDNIQVLIVSPGRINTPISKSALLKDGSEHGELDLGQANGMDVDKCADQIVSAIINGKKDVLIGKKELLMVYIRRFFPWLYHRLVLKVGAK